MSRDGCATGYAGTDRGAAVSGATARRGAVVYNGLSPRPGVHDGAATFSLNLLHHLPEALPEFQLVAYVRADEDRIVEDSPLELRRVAGVRSSLERILCESAWLAAELRRTRATLLISPHESTPLAPPCPVLLVAQNLAYHCPRSGPRFWGDSRRARVAARAQDAYYRRRMRLSFRRAAAVVAVSDEARRLLAQRAALDPRKTTVVHEGADSLLLPPPGAAGPRVPRLLVVSALSPYKNLEATLTLFARLAERRPELTLDIVGGDWRGYRRVVEARIDDLGLAKSVTLRGMVSPRELVGLYSESLALLSLSACESFGLPVVEAMRYGLPVVVAERSSLPETAGGAALVVNPSDPTYMVERVGAVVDDQRLRDRLAERGRKRAAELSWRQTAEGVAGVVRRVVCGGPPPRW